MHVLTTVLAQDDAADQGSSWLQTVQSGGPVGYLILLLSVVALAFIVMHFVQIRRGALIRPDHLDQIDTMLGRHDVDTALAKYYASAREGGE